MSKLRACTTPPSSNVTSTLRPRRQDVTSTIDLPTRRTPSETSGRDEMQGTALIGRQRVVAHYAISTTYIGSAGPHAGTRLAVCPATHARLKGGRMARQAVEPGRRGGSSSDKGPDRQRQVRTSITYATMAIVATGLLQLAAGALFSRATEIPYSISK
jgi:hypothetical protein